MRIAKRAPWVLVLVSGLLGSCTHDPRGERAIQGHNVLPDYIAAAPLENSIGIVVGHNTAQLPSGMSLGGSAPDMSAYAEAFGRALVPAFAARGYRAVYLGRMTTLCSTSAGEFCPAVWERGEGTRLRALLAERKLANSLILQVNYRPGGANYAPESGGTPMRDVALHMQQHLRDDTGLVLRTGLVALRRQQEVIRELTLGGAVYNTPTGIPWGLVKFAGRKPDGQAYFAMRTADEWGQELAQRYVERQFPPFEPRSIPSAAELERLLTGRSWRANWAYNEKADGSPKGSGSHTVMFQKRGDTMVAVIGPDPAMGIGALEAPVTVTRIGITYFIPTFGRVRLTPQRGGVTFIGATYSQVQMQSLAELRLPDDNPLHVATFELRAN